MDIKSLYYKAKNAGEYQAYSEAVNQLSQSNPREYVSQLEYIIKSNIGLPTVMPFIEKYGLSIPLYESMMNMLEKSKEMSHNSSYTEMVDKTIDSLKAYKEKYIHCFAMYEYYNEGRDPSSYINTYYGENSNHIQNRMLMSGMIKKFGECAIPDILITANSTGSMNKMLKYISENSNDMMLNQWIYTSCKSFGESADNIKPKTAEAIVAEMQDRNKRIYQEAVVTMNDDAVLEYSREELDAIGTLISFKEYQVTWAEELGINLNECMNEIYSLYEEYDCMEFEDVADNVLSMKPQPLTEKPINTTDKKTGTSAQYIKRNHDMAKWGEEDEDPKDPKDSSDNNDDASLDDFKRPSAVDDGDNSNFDDSSDDKSNKKSDEDDKDDEPKTTGNNYYYYTYNNSLNKNSTHTSNDSHDNVYRTDDHSRHSNVVNNNGDVAVNRHHDTADKKIDADSNKHKMDVDSKTSVDGKKIDADLAKHIVDTKSKTELEKEKLRANEKKPEIPFTSMEMFNLDLGAVGDTLFTEKTDYYYDGDAYDKHIKRQWFVKSDNNIENCCVSLSGYSKPLRGKSTLIVLREMDGKWHALIKKEPNGDYEFPGGGWDKGENPEEAAIRETHEEGRAKSKNVKRVGTSIKYNDKDLFVKPWVKKHIPENDWWYGYYTAIFIGEYDGEFTGNISEKDRESGFKWKSLDFIKKKIPSKLQTIIAKYINEINVRNGNFNEYTFEEYCGDPIYEAVDVAGKKFDKAYKAVYNYDNGHMLKITYSLQDSEITNVGISKPVKDSIDGLVKNINREKQRGRKSTAPIRAFLVLLKGCAKHKKNVNERKKFITEFLNTHIGSIGYLDFQAKNCKVLSVYDMYDNKEVNTDVNTVGVFTAKGLQSGKRNILSESDLKKVHNRVETSRGKYKVSPTKVGQIDKFPSFMSTYWDDKSDHMLMSLDQKVIESDSEDRQLDNTNSISEIIDGLEFKGYHVDDEAVEKFIKDFRNEDMYTFLNSMNNPYRESTITEDVEESNDGDTPQPEDVEKDRPESDHPIRDTFSDIDRKLLQKQQGAKKVVQNVQIAGRAAMKPITRTKQWISNMVARAKDYNETNVKEKMADPHGRSALFSAIKSALKIGSLAKAGLLLNPIILFLGVTHKATKGSKERRLRNEMIGELKTEMAIVDEKIKDADSKGDNKAKYQLMRFKNELNKKLLRVGGGKGWSKAI